MKAEGSDHLRRALRRLIRFARAQPPARSPDDAEPLADWAQAQSWQQRTDERLLAIEKTLAGQSRLLLISVLSIVAETIYRIVVR